MFNVGDFVQIRDTIHTRKDSELTQYRNRAGRITEVFNRTEDPDEVFDAYVTFFPYIDDDEDDGTVVEWKEIKVATRKQIEQYQIGIMKGSHEL